MEKLTWALWMRDASSFVMRPLSPPLPEAEEFCWPDMVTGSGVCLFVLEGWKVGNCDLLLLG
jgi:hypothetical protein